MVPSIARQSVIIKCLREKSVIVGNYEFYYAAGLLNHFYNLGLRKDMNPQELMEQIQQKIHDIVLNSPKEEYLLHLLKYYEFLESYDEQMQLLFDWGDREKDEWKINTSYEP